MDTRLPEQIAETLVTSRLLDAGILVAKPFFDRSGCDLIGFSSIEDKARFCRIQCKYRELRKTTSVKVDAEYVVGSFVLFVYIKTQQESHLFCFLPDDIRRIFTRDTLGTGSFFRLSISCRTAVSLAQDEAVAFTRKKVAAISALMKSSSLDSEFRRMGFDLVLRMQKMARTPQEARLWMELSHDFKNMVILKVEHERRLAGFEEYLTYMANKLHGQTQHGHEGAQ